jgi:amino acid adenylation domain-containing protein
MDHVPITELFERCAARFGDRVAIEWEGNRVTYAQVDERSRQIEAELVVAGVVPGALVAILASMTADVVAAMLGILRAGAAFVPFDRHFPATRLESAIREVAPRYWLVDEAMKAEVEASLRAQGFEAIVLGLPAGWLQGVSMPSSVARPTSRALDPDGMAYVYFTSGSTGKPKAIAGRLAGIDHFIRWIVETFDLGPETRMCQISSFAFDGFLEEAFTPLACGGALVVSSERETILDPVRLADWLERDRIGLVHCTPSLFRSLISQELGPERFPALRYVLLAGEAVLPSDVRRWISVFGERIRLVNLYGPTETTITKFVYFVKTSDGEARTVPIGQPMPGARAILVDEKLRACPPGKLGEILIRTRFRSLGYLNDPVSTAEKFILNPFSDRTDDIVYRTGDLARVRDDGDFEFFGRRDAQVKIRGVRIELAPIEDLLRSHPAVLDVAVIDRVDGLASKYLCAYLVLADATDPSALRDLLLEHLPESSVPSAFMVMDDLPRTLNGKVDRKALPDPGEGGVRLAREYVPPRTPVEETLCRIFSDLLRVERVGIRDNFFELGGHSLLVMQMLARIRKELAPLPLGQVFQTPTVEGLSVAVAEVQLKRAGRAPAEGLIAEIEKMSDEEVDRILAAEGTIVEASPISGENR